MNKVTALFHNLSVNLEYNLILFLTFLAVTLLVGAITYVFINRDRIGDRLSKLLAPANPAEQKAENKLRLVEEAPEGLAARINKPFNKLTAPASYDARSTLRLRLMRAGLRSKRAMGNFLACKVAGAVLFPFFFLLSSFIYKISPERLLIMVLLAVFGFFLPDLVLYVLTQKRKDAINKALPDALDLMVVCVEAGLGLDMTFKRVGEEIRSICKELSDEFTITILEIRSGQSRNDSFKNMALRTGVAEVGHLMTVLTQTSRFGTSVAQALRVHADAMRVKRRQTAEEIAAKAAVKLLFPLVLFIFPAIFIVLLGPSAITIFRIVFPALRGG